MDEERARQPAGKRQQLPILSLQSTRQSTSPSSPVSPKREAEDEPSDPQRRPGAKRRRTRDDRQGDGKGKGKENENERSAYKDLFEQDVREFLGEDPADADRAAASFRAPGNSKGDGSSQHGAVRWEPAEKARFFSALDRRGRHDLPAVSAAIGSKSEPEVADYLCILQDAYRERHLQAGRLALHRYEELPAAVEVGEELVEALEVEADRLREEDAKLSHEREQKEHGKWALIHYDLAKKLSGQVKNEATELEPEQGSLAFALSLFHVTTMLKLSATLFMNSKHEESNWMYLAPDGEVPAVFQTCLVDICNLVVSITERIVSSANFFALSRIRATDSRAGRNVSRVVNRADVLAAVETLNMPVDSWNFWVRCPRRCQLSVHEDLETADDDDEGLSYDLVESTLAEPSGREPTATSDLVTADAVEMDPDDDNMSESSASSMSRSSRATRSSNRTRSTAGSRAGSRSTARSTSRNAGRYTAESDWSSDDEEKLELAEDDFADAADQRASSMEQNLLREALRIPAPREASDVETTTGLPRARTRSGAHLRRKRAEDLKDWRDWCRYKVKWERYPEPLAIDMPYHGLLEDHMEQRDEEVAISDEGDGTSEEISGDDGDESVSE